LIEAIFVEVGFGVGDFVGSGVGVLSRWILSGVICSCVGLQ
jgi:hypothetical protein